MSFVIVGAGAHYNCCFEGLGRATIMRSTTVQGQSPVIQQDQDTVSLPICSRLRTLHDPLDHCSWSPRWRHSPGRALQPRVFPSLCSLSQSHHPFFNISLRFCLIVWRNLMVLRRKTSGTMKFLRFCFKSSRFSLIFIDFQSKNSNLNTKITGNCIKTPKTSILLENLLIFFDFYWFSIDFHWFSLIFIDFRHLAENA